MKTVRVVAAIIKAENKEGEPIIFATQRGYGDLKGGWEFPGGKIEEGETPQEALKREIMEELDTEISVGELIETIEYDYPTFHLSIEVGDYLCTVDYDYPEFHLTMHCYMCRLASDDIQLLEHEAAKWLTKDSMDSVDWLPADITLIDKVRESI